jgi:hypothetical protein
MSDKLTKELENNKIIALMQKDISDLKDTSRRIEEKLDAFIMAADDKYSGKWVEKVTVKLGYAIGGVLVTGLIGFLFYLLVMHPAFITK